MQSYGTYTEEQQKVLKERNKELIGHMRHYDEIVSHGKNKHVVRGFIADRGFEKAIKQKFYQTVDGRPWGLSDVELVKSALVFQGDDQNSAMRTDWVVGPCPPGYHKPDWERKPNASFEPIQPASHTPS